MVLPILYYIYCKHIVRQYNIAYSRCKQCILHHCVFYNT